MFHRTLHRSHLRPTPSARFWPRTWPWLLMAASLMLPFGGPARSHGGEEIVFADDFDAGLSSRWDLTGVRAEDYRLRDGGLELRVQPGKLTSETPVLRVALPQPTPEDLLASVEVTVLDPFTEPEEMAGLFLTTNGRPELGVRKQQLDGRLMLAPGQPEFLGKPGEEGDPHRYAWRYWPATSDTGPLRIIVRNHVAFLQTGPNVRGAYLNLFHSAVTQHPQQRGFALVAAGGPSHEHHWVRFDHVRIWREK